MINSKKRLKDVILLISFIFLFFLLNYSFLDNKLKNFFTDYKTGVVERIIDGDTIIIDNQSVRLIGINTPERGEKYYEEARDFLNKTLLNKTVLLEYSKEKYDRYKRELAFIFLDNKNINLNMIEQGYGNVYILNEKKYEKDLRDAWERCIKDDIRLCKKSYDECSLCIRLEDFSIKNQEITIRNSCNFSCNLTNWQIKDEGRKKFIFPYFILKPSEKVRVIVNKEENKTNTNNLLYWNEKDYVWTEGGDTLFLRDKENNLVLWKFLKE